MATLKISYVCVSGPLKTTCMN